MNVFNFREYREYIRHQITQNEGQKGYRSTLARAAGCQQSFISQVLANQVEMTPDHAAGLSEFWKHSRTETEYFLCLVLSGRARSKKLQANLTRRMNELSREQNDLSQRLDVASVADSATEALYFSSWYWSAVCTILAIERYRQSEDEIAARLNLPQHVVQSAILGLSKMGLIKKVGGKWKLTDQKIHLPRRSFMNEMNHTNWRQQAILNVQKQQPDAVHYTSVFAASHADFDKIRGMIFDLIEQKRNVIEASPSEELICFNCDYFVV